MKAIAPNLCSDSLADPVACLLPDTADATVAPPLAPHAGCLPLFATFQPPAVFKAARCPPDYVNIISIISLRPTTLARPR
jgi:hypothetical protein